MFGISYDTWNSVCQMYIKIGDKKLRHYLQWFPYAYPKCLNQLSSDVFYNHYIKNGYYVFHPLSMLKTDNYMYKSDGSFRDSILISPVLYLILQSIGKKISDLYHFNRDYHVQVYYAGSYDNADCHYFNEYEKYQQDINLYRESTDYFIKTDIQNFYQSINIHKLFELIDNNINFNSSEINPAQLNLYKSLFSYCGMGKFPIVENSIASSYLATIVYLEPIDNALSKYLSSCDYIASFQLLRYVDDLYIFLKTDIPEIEFLEKYHEILNKYTSILKEYDLALNISKCYPSSCTGFISDLSYDDSTSGSSLSNQTLEIFINFLNELVQRTENHIPLSSEDYNSIINTIFGTDSIVVSPTERLNSCIYHHPDYAKNEQVIQCLSKLCDNSFSFHYLDPKRFTHLILNTHDGDLIKRVLNNLFKRHRGKDWTAYDMIVVVNYLIQRRMEHEDLLNIIMKKSGELYSYCTRLCRKNFIKIMVNESASSFENLFDDDKLSYLYLMYLIEKDVNNWMNAFAYFKSYFDRMSAHFGHIMGYDSEFSPEKYFKLDKLTKVYREGIKNSEDTIRLAQKLRITNPLIHASSELVDNENSTNELKKLIIDMTELINKFLLWYKNQSVSI